MQCTCANGKGSGSTKEILQPETRGCAVCSWGFGVVEHSKFEVQGHSTQVVAEVCGPYRVLEKIGAQAYRLKLPDTWRVHQVFHVSLLKPWRPSVVQQVPGDVELENADQPQYFDIQKILRWRWNSKT